MKGQGMHKGNPFKNSSRKESTSSLSNPWIIAVVGGVLATVISAIIIEVIL